MRPRLRQPLVPPLSGGPGDHDSETTHGPTIANSGTVGPLKAGHSANLDSGHYSHVEQSQRVVSAIKDVIAQAVSGRS